LENWQRPLNAAFGGLMMVGSPSFFAVDLALSRFCAGRRAMNPPPSVIGQGG
jgi:hypothetical protein